MSDRAYPYDLQRVKMCRTVASVKAQTHNDTAASFSEICKIPKTAFCEKNNIKGIIGSRIATCRFIGLRCTGYVEYTESSTSCVH